MDKHNRVAGFETAAHNLTDEAVALWNGIKVDATDMN